jgi:hypothetical protein
MTLPQEIAFLELQSKKQRAYRIVKKALISGALVRPEQCQTCGKACRPDAHHHDYEQPLEIEWLCKSCHNLINAAKRRENHPVAPKPAKKTPVEKREFVLACPTCGVVRWAPRLSHPSFRPKNAEGHYVVICSSCNMNRRRAIEHLSALEAVEKRKTKQTSKAYFEKAVFSHLHRLNSREKAK